MPAIAVSRPIAYESCTYSAVFITARLTNVGELKIVTWTGPAGCVGLVAKLRYVRFTLSTRSVVTSSGV